jgi:murein DD-endopeptidase MepM/ murein hydrolase activator NlpD
MDQEFPSSSLALQKPRPIEHLGPGYRPRLRSQAEFRPVIQDRPWTIIQDKLSSFAHDDVSPIRAASHLALLLVTVLVLTLTQVQWPDWGIPWQLSTPATNLTQSAAPLFQAIRNDPRTGVGNNLMRAAVPITQIPDRPREEITHYVVVPGDTLTSIAKKFKISVDSVKWANELELNPDLLRVGQDLIILPVSGVYHLVEEGETLTQIARRYKVKPEAIVEYKPNNLKDVNDRLPADKVLIIPGGEKPWVAPYVSAYSGPIPKAASKGTGRFVWPATGRITSLAGQLVKGKPHKGLDIGARTGTSVVASDSGYVTFAGWDRTGYGNLVIINHGNGFITYYAHLSKILVQRGDSVAVGQRIGSVGCSGTCTGSHLHFEIRQNDVSRNPLGFLP